MVFFRFPSPLCHTGPFEDLPVAIHLLRPQVHQLGWWLRCTMGIAYAVIIILVRVVRVLRGGEDDRVRGVDGDIVVEVVQRCQEKTDIGLNVCLFEAEKRCLPRCSRVGLRVRCVS